MLDADYNGLMLCVSQVFFPRGAWDNLKKSPKAEFEDGVWEHLAGTESERFALGEQQRIAVKVIDERGNELMVVREPLDLMGRFLKFSEWDSGEVQPTLRQLEGFARAVHVPVGYLFLPAPPEEGLPIPDFRSLGGRDVARQSPNPLDILYLCQPRQEWHRNYACMHGLEPLAFMGSAQAGCDPVVQH